MTGRYRLLLSAAILTLPASEAFAQAEQQRQETTATDALMADIIVTARKKSVAESAQDVPIALNAMSGDQIEASFSSDLTEVGRIMPNVRLDTANVFVGVANYSIRGMGFLSTIASAEPTVGVFVDGVYLGVNIGGAPSTYDLESVEVLRGPQGTLFGRNVTAGAVVMRSRRPTGDFGVTLRTGIGNGEKAFVAGSIEGAITPTLSGKVFAQRSHLGGYYRNIARGGSRFGEQDDFFVRPILRWQPSDDLEVVFTGEYGHTTGDGAPARLVDDITTTVTKSGILAPRGARNISIPEPGRTRLTWHQAALEINYDIGNGVLTSVTGYRDVDYRGEVGQTYAPPPAVISTNWVDQWQVSQELRYAGDALDGRLDYTFGVYYFQQKQQQDYINATPLLITRGFLRNKAASAFVQADFEIVPSLTLTGGVRYNWEAKRARVAKGTQCNLAFTCNLAFNDRETWKDWTPKVGLSWKASDNVLAYASYTRGFRSGGYNIRVVSPTENPGPYDPETVDSFEAGLKTEFWGGRARLNLAGFYARYKDLQRTVFNPLINSNQIFNAASSNIPGFEADLTLMPIDGLVLAGSVGYVHARYKRFDLLDVNGDGKPDPELAKGNQLLRAPDWTYAVQATYDWKLEGTGVITPRVAYSYTDRSPLNEGNTRYLDAYGILDASLTYTTPNGKLKISAWGKNLTDKLYALTGAATPTVLTIYQSPPRSYGLDFVYEF